MNEQLQGAVAQILERAISGMDSSIEFMQAELPDVIEQLLMWYAVSNAMYALVGVAFLYLAYLVVKKPKATQENWMWNWDERSNCHRGTRESDLGAFSVFPAAIGLFLLSNIMESIQIWIAPKVWLMEYAAKLVS